MSSRSILHTPQRRLALLLLAGVLLTAVAGCGDTQSEPSDLQVKAEDTTWQAVEGWQFVRLAQPLESAHPYANDLTLADLQPLHAPTDAAEFKVNFNRLQVENGYDTVVLLDADRNVVQELTGTFRGWSESIPGNLGYVGIVSDYSVTRHGYTIDGLQYRALPSAGEWYDQTLAPADEIHTAHPYANSFRQKWTIRAIPEARRVRLHLEGVDLERGYDFIYIYDGNGAQVASYTGRLGDLTSVEVGGNIATVELVTDYSVTRYGFDLASYEVLVDAAGCSADADCGAGERCEQVQCVRWPCPALCVPADTCEDDAQCPDWHACNGGVCETFACPKHYAPVCGLDGETYGNDCIARARHIIVAYDGECAPCEDDASCGEGQVCEQTAYCPPCVYADPPCRVACRAINHCVEQPARACGARLGDTCDAGEFCDFTLDAQCGYADATGTCQPVPTVCTREYMPVCGCDGTTYSNTCSAQANGIAVLHAGACQSEPQVCGTRGAAACGADQYCHFEGSAQCGALDHGGVCLDVPHACDALDAPVCGCDGRDYPNPCAAAQHGISVAHDGACAPEPRGCQVGGCSGQICHEEGEPVFTTCQWHPSYACLREATCERQDDGGCGWTQTDASQACLDRISP